MWHWMHLASIVDARRLDASTLSLRSSTLWITASTCISSAGQESIEAFHTGLSLPGIWGIIKEPVYCAHSTMMTNAVKWMPFLQKSIVLIFSLHVFPRSHHLPFLISFTASVCLSRQGGKKNLLYACRSVCHCVRAMMHLKISEWKHAKLPHHKNITQSFWLFHRDFKHCVDMVTVCLQPLLTV